MCVYNVGVTEKSISKLLYDHDENVNEDEHEEEEDDKEPEPSQCYCNEDSHMLDSDCVMCDGCDVWFHLECLATYEGLDLSTDQLADMEWFCSKAGCKEKEERKLKKKTEKVAQMARIAFIPPKHRVKAKGAAPGKK